MLHHCSTTCRAAAAPTAALLALLLLLQLRFLLMVQLADGAGNQVPSYTTATLCVSCWRTGAEGVRGVCGV